ncbi:MBL fold metallo-hydrolase [Nanoarchaeota archaeon]
MTEMRIKYYGVRGSIPAPMTSKQILEKQIALIEHISNDDKVMSGDVDIKDYISKLPLSLRGTFGGNTTCIEIQIKDSPLIIVDAGTGIRDLGNELFGRQKKFNGEDSVFNFNPLNENEEYGNQIHLFLTHFHWDHIQGLPFFGPAFNDKVKLFFYGKANTTSHISDVLKGQQNYPNFPVKWEDMQCGKDYLELSRMGHEGIEVGNSIVTYAELTHPDSVFAYAFETLNKNKFVVATDTEHKDSPDPRLEKIAKNADLMCYDVQYRPEQYCNEKMPLFDWGHSTYEWAVKNALFCNIKEVHGIHHDPPRNDFGLEELEKDFQGYRDEMLKLEENKDKSLEAYLAYEGMVREF